MKKMLAIAIRVDASSQIGIGHFMRCLTLADALKQRGAQIRFVCRHLPKYLQDMLVNKGHELMRLNNKPNGAIIDTLAHAHWLGVSQNQDAAATKHALSGQAWDWLIVDHYALDARWESALRQVAKKILVIDDIADRQHACDVLLDQNFYVDMETRYTDKVPAHCQLLLGPRYALLRDEFLWLREQTKPRLGAVKNILVFFGGVDPENCTSLVIQALTSMSNEGLHVDVVIGAQHPNYEQIRQACYARGYTCHVQTKRMAELMAAADLAIGAGGSTTWERMCLGLPAIVISIADNQTPTNQALMKAGYINFLGELSSVTEADIVAGIHHCLASPDVLRIQSTMGRQLVAGGGAGLVCEQIFAESRKLNAA